eukprot:649764-Pyramimonas_sp.AAC.1
MRENPSRLPKTFLGAQGGRHTASYPPQRPVPPSHVPTADLCTCTLDNIEPSRMQDDRVAAFSRRSPEEGGKREEGGGRMEGGCCCC